MTPSPPWGCSLCLPESVFQVIFPPAAQTAFQGSAHKGVCLLLVASLGQKIVGLLKLENESPGSLETPAPAAGAGKHGVKLRPRWLLWKSFVRNCLARKGTVLRCRGLNNHISLLTPAQSLFLPIPHLSLARLGRNYPVPEKASVKLSPPLLEVLFLSFTHFSTLSAAQQLLGAPCTPPAAPSPFPSP